MSSIPVAPAAERLERAVLAAADADPARCAERILALLLDAVPAADAGALLLMHPQTGLFWSGAVLGLPVEACHPFFTAEMSADDHTFRRMAAVRSGARALSRQGGRPGGRHRDGHTDGQGDGRGDEDGGLGDLVRRLEYVDEVRALCLDGTTAWAGVTLWSRTGAFDEADEALLDTVSDAVGARLRDSVLAGLESGRPCAPGRGVVVVADGRIVEAALGGAPLGEELLDPKFESYRHLEHLVALAAADPRFSTLIRDADGFWISAHGTELGDGRVAILLTAATPAELLGARVAAAGLTVREVEVTRLLCRGLSDAEIAGELFLSPHTVHDHVRSVRRKLGVRRRSGIAAQVFSDAYFDTFVSSAAVRHDASS